MDILRIVGGLFLINCLLSYFITNDSMLWGWRPWFVRPAVVMRHFVSITQESARQLQGTDKYMQQGPVSLTDAELRSYDGSDPNKPIYLALNGTIYDVTAGRRVYGPGGSYSVFAGKDATRGFVTGCFGEDSTPDLRGAEWTYVSVDVPDFDEKDGVKVTAEQKKLREQELRKARKKVKDTIEGWTKMFNGEGGKDYFKVGTVKREPGWLEKLPKRTLCAQAQKSRPKPKTAGKDAGAAYRPN
jgi:predicted heme/steroid binding protein